MRCQLLEIEDLSTFQQVDLPDRVLPTSMLPWRVTIESYSCRILEICALLFCRFMVFSVVSMDSASSYKPS